MSERELSPFEAADMEKELMSMSIDKSKPCVGEWDAAGEKALAAGHGLILDYCNATFECKALSERK